MDRPEYLGNLKRVNLSGSELVNPVIVKANVQVLIISTLLPSPRVIWHGQSQENTGGLESVVPGLLRQMPDAVVMKLIVFYSYLGFHYIKA